MESLDQSHLLLCGKEYLVEYIMKLKEGIQNIIDVKDEEIKSLHDKLVLVKEENEELKRVADHAENVLEDSPVEEDDEGFAISDWFHEKMAKHIKFHMTDPGGEYNYIDPETKKHIFCLGSKGTLDDCRDFVENLEKEIEELKKQLAEMTQFHEWDKIANFKWQDEKAKNEELKEENENLKKEFNSLKGKK